MLSMNRYLQWGCAEMWLNTLASLPRTPHILERFTDYSPCLKTGGSDLASTLSILHAIEPCGRSLRLSGRWTLPLIQIRGSETDVSSFAHWRVLAYDPRPHPNAGGNVS